MASWTNGENQANDILYLYERMGSLDGAIIDAHKQLAAKPEGTATESGLESLTARVADLELAFVTWTRDTRTDVKALAQTVDKHVTATHNYAVVEKGLDQLVGRLELLANRVEVCEVLLHTQGDKDADLAPLTDLRAEREAWREMCRELQNFMHQELGLLREQMAGIERRLEQVEVRAAR